MRTGGKNILGAAKLGQKFEPLILRAETTVDPSTHAAPNNSALINPTGEPWEIHEIHFGVRRENNADVTRATGATLDVTMSWLGKPITDGAVPVWNCMAQQAVEEHRALMDVTSGAIGTYFLAQDSFYAWKLDHPLFIPPKKSIAVEFRNNGIVNSAIRASISLIGRVLPRSAAPSKVRVPYVSAWKSNAFDFLSGSTAPQTSPETVLFNQFKSPLTVERFVGRIASRVQYASSASSYVFVDQVPHIAFRGGWIQAKHRMTDGHIVARDWVRFGDLYGWRNFKATNRHVLDPGVGHIIEVKATPPSNGALNALLTAAAAQTSVSIVGWREEEIP